MLDLKSAKGRDYHKILKLHMINVYVYFRSILKLYTLSFVQSSAWHMILGNNLSNSVSLQDKLVQDIVWLREELDTKETNFYLSSLLTGIV